MKRQGVRPRQSGSLPASALWLTAAFLATPAGATHFSIGLNFQGTTLSQSGFIPPDTMGAVGSSHVVEIVNGRYRVYNKITGGILASRTLNQFWTDAGVSNSGNSFDPRIIYDPDVQRWYAASVDNALGNNNLKVAVSRTANPLDGWNAFNVDSDTDDTRWADFPQLGYDNDGVYISANMFPQTGQSVGATVSMLVLPKSDLLLATPSVASSTLLEDIAGTTGFSVQPLVDLEGSGTATFFGGETSSAIFLSSLGGTISNPTIQLGPIVGTTFLAAPPLADQPGPKTNLDSGGIRLRSSAYQVDGSYWGVQGGTDPVSGNAAVRWYEIDALTETLVQEGLIADSDLDFIFPSIAVNDFGDIVIGFTGTSETVFPSSYAVVGSNPSGGAVFDTPVVLRAGLDDYQRLDTSGRNRWGDYSATVIDPSDPRTFWTFQEFVVADDSWAVQISEINIIPEPGTLLLLLLGLAGLLHRASRRIATTR